VTVSLKSAREVGLMRAAGAVVADVLDLLYAEVTPGVTTRQLDAIARKAIEERGGFPSFFGYDGFPASICTSVNDEVVHGIPSRYALRNGDIISIDVGVFLNGYHADAAVTWPVGEVSEEARRLIDTTEEAFRAALAVATPQHRLGDIGHAVESVAKAAGFGVVTLLSGHGVGRSLHEGPSVPNVGEPDTGARLRAGMTLAIEPMLTVGDGSTNTRDDGWTEVTLDGGLAAHYEHTVLITASGPELLTVSAKDVV
jgi:methionyl aminopeptidase